MEDRFRFGPALALITAVGMALRFYGIPGQPLTDDDIGVMVSASNYMETGHLGPTMWNHPPLRNIFVYWFLGLFGDSVWGLKFASLILGSLTVPLLGMAALMLLKRKDAALLAAMLLAVDSLHIDFSRQAVHEVYMAFFSLAGICLAVGRGAGLLPLVLSGLCFGLGLSSKWYVAFSLLATYAFLIYRLSKEQEAGFNEKLSSLVFMTASLAVIPVVVYSLSFLPWFERGYGFSDWLFLQRSMSGETVAHEGYNPYGFEIDHKAYLWFIKPVAFADLARGEGGVGILLGISNPLVWLLTLPSTVYLFRRGMREGNAGAVFVSGLFWFTYVPFLIAGRPIWAHSAFSVLPMAFMAIAYALTSPIEGKRHGQKALLAYVVLVLVASVPLYLLAVGKGLDLEWLRPLVMLYKPSYEW